MVINSPLVWNPMAHYHLHKSPPLAAILCQINSVHGLKSHIFKIHFNIILYLRVDLSSRHSFKFSIKILCAFLISPMHATCRFHLIPPYLISVGPTSYQVAKHALTVG
jgi:hypothetical protein